MLNDKAIKVAPPGSHRAGDNLYIRVSPAGSKTFYARFLHNKKPMWKRLGKYPELTLAAARAQTAALIKAINSGDAAANDVLRTVSEAFDLYYAHLSRQYRRPEQTKRIFDMDILPHIGKLALQELTRSECTAVLQRVLDRDAPTAANRTMEALKRMLNFCEQRGWIKANPMAGVRRASIGGKETAREVSLPFDRIEALICSLWGSPRMQPGTKWALYMILLTGLRSTEVLKLRDDGTTITKMNRTHRIPLSPHVRAMLKIRPVMPGQHGVMAAALRKLKVEFTPHDLRRTFATRLSDLGVMPHVIEKMLDHKMEGVMAVYNRAEYWPERVAAQRLWGLKLAELRRKR